MRYEPTLLIDCHAACYRAYYSVGALSHGERATGIPYGFFNLLLECAQRFKTCRFALLWDAPGSKRKRLFPAYKATRQTRDKTEKEKEERASIHAQINTLRDEIIPQVVGLADGSHIQPGFEADDLIAWYPVNDPNNHYVAVSADHDLLQLLEYPNFKLWCPGSANRWAPEACRPRLWTRDEFKREYKIEPREWVAVKCMAGCTSDSVPGIPGVGEATAIKYLRGELNPNSVKFQAIKNGGAIIRRNLPLVKLPFRGVENLLPAGHVIEQSSLANVFQDLGFESFLKKGKTLSNDWLAITCPF